MIPQQFIDDLNQRINIVDVIGKHVQLKQAGNEFKGLCPFHTEKTPSFTVNTKKQFFHCFGCGESGNAIKFLTKHEGKTLREAVDELASSASLEVPGKSNGSRQRKSAVPDATFYELIERVCDSYQEHLLGKQPYAAAASYLEERGINRQTAETFRLGYAPDTWDYLLRRFGQSATERRQLEDAGLIIRKDNDDGHFYDRFRGRLMFPIIDSRNRVVAFGGRTTSDQKPKYTNSPTTALFKKSRELFGVVQAQAEIVRTRKVLVVEGYTDVLALHQHGVTNVVASCGTAVTTEQIRRLFELSDEIIFSFDGDAAGYLAAEKTSKAVLPELVDGKMASLMLLPDDADPDLMIRSNPEWFKNEYCDRIEVLEFLVNRIKSSCGMPRLDGRARFVKLTDEVIGLLPETSILR